MKRVSISRGGRAYNHRGNPRRQPKQPSVRRCASHAWERIERGAMAQRDPYWTTHRSEILHVMMVDGCAIRVGRDAKVRAARVQRRQDAARMILPFTVDERSIVPNRHLHAQVFIRAQQAKLLMAAIQLYSASMSALVNAPGPSVCRSRCTSNSAARGSGTLACGLRTRPSS